VGDALSGGAVVERPKRERSAAADPYLTASTAAWLCAIPCAALVLLAMLVLGPWVGGVLGDGRGDFRFLPIYRLFVLPEPTEQGRFLLALSAPIVLSLATVAVMRRRPRLPLQVQTAGVAAGQLTTIVLLAACVIGQYDVRYGETYLHAPVTIGWRYFTPTTLAAAAAIALLLPLALRPPAVRALVRRCLRESTLRLTAASVAAIAITAIWLLHAVHSDQSIANAPESAIYHAEFTLDEAFAILNGRTPLVDFSAQYGSLLPWVGALSMLAFGKTLLVFTIAMCSVTALAMLALFDVLRRATRSATAALLLYLPLLATSFFQVRGTALDRETPATYLGLFPLRYAGPYLLAWLLARQLEARGRPAGLVALFAVAGLVLLNNLEFGLPALAATVAALAWTSPLDRRSLLRAGAALAAGLVTALALVSLLLLLRAGSLPRLWRLTDYAEMYGRGGFGLLPIANPLGLHVAIYLTFVAAIAAATVRAVSRAPNRVLTGMLAWSGVFGLGTGSYFVGRSHPEALVASFSAWALALALLAAVVAPRLVAQPFRRPSLGTLMVLFGLGVMTCSLAQTPAPWAHLARLDAPFTSTTSLSERPLLHERDPDTRRFVSSVPDGRARFVVRRGAPVAILLTTGHRVADTYGVVNVSPYTGWNSMETEERVEATLDALQAAGGSTVIVPREVDTEIFLLLARRGFEVLTESGRLARFGPRRVVRHIVNAPWLETTLTKWFDRRRWDARALG
jgi:hypothetical protein